MESTSWLEGNVNTDDQTVEIRDGSLSADSFGLTALAHSLQQINEQANVSEADVPTRLPAMTIPIKTLTPCLDQKVTGVNFSRKEMLDGISHIITEVHRMGKKKLAENLASLDIDNSGTRQELIAKLKGYHEHQKMYQYHQMLPFCKRMQFDYLLVIDFETSYRTSVQEIIEFPVVMVDVRRQTIQGGFQKFCKPTVNPVLTEYCTTLTGINQAQVDDAMTFPEVLKEFNEWLSNFKLDSDYKFAVVTDGGWHMAKMLKRQLQLAGLDIPWWARQWVNIRKVYKAFYRSGYVNHMKKMVHNCGMEFEARPRSGMFDAIDVAAVVVTLLCDGCIFTFNEHFCPYACHNYMSRPP